ncbi:hypothetical protein TraAM80_09536 [Trypanosoma rangeli]|uniref:Uncharacterized protein n=1 Tax=Trypanosoma rangeli TaxID=5698 RepID=A0A3R7JXG5_TRYRA|nr:uncharacterized protein TraAM80_09536 [Trypanosoma rangeli]RNE97020.1 hypothetical protein TraAM80_09536 [Trypanosoma rangeli]|eukprot:RNE97020.1 hypothetical protein TraAM80_09536 [Trypanosoma rangeli]
MRAKCGHAARKGTARVGPIRRGVSDPRGCQIANSRHGSIGQIATWAADCCSRLNETDLWPCTVPGQDWSAAVWVAEGRGTGRFQNTPDSAAVGASVSACAARAARPRRGYTAVPVAH